MSGGQSKDPNELVWSCVTEETLLLRDDLLRLVDFIPLPSGIGTTAAEEDYGLPVLDGKSPGELAEVISRECGVKTTTYKSLMEYRLNALKGFWHSLALKENKIKEKKKVDDFGGSTSVSKSSSKGEGFASRVSLILIFPILHSLSKLDTMISRETAKILLESLQGCDPISLSKEPLDCILGLENLLCSWLKTTQDDPQSTREQMQISASALVALSVAVGTGSLLLRTVHMLQSLDSTHKDMELCVGGVLHKLLKEHLKYEEPPVIINDSHVQCWNYDYQQDNNYNDTNFRSILFDGRCLLVTSTGGKRLIQLGTGIRGTIRGYVYNTRDIDHGWVVYCQDYILYRKASFDESSTQFCILLNARNLEEYGNVTSDVSCPEPHTTLHLLSDGFKIYWLYYIKQQETNPDKTKYHNVFLQIINLKTSGGDAVHVVSHSERILLKKPIMDSKSSSDNNSSMMKALMRASSTYASSFSAMLNGGGGGKDDMGSSCGLGMKQLNTSAAYCTGSSLVIMCVPPSSTSSGRTSLFGTSTSTQSTGKCLCMSFSYNITSGSLASQSESLSLTPQLQCGLSKCRSVRSLAACYDYSNHCVWTVCDDWVDIWTCIGKVRPAAHVLAVRMGKGDLEGLIPTSLQGNMLSIGEAIELLLRHSGIESCRLAPGKDLGSHIPHNLSIDFLRHCCDILEYSLTQHQADNTLSSIITLQAVLPGFLLSHSYPLEDVSPLTDRIRTYLWRIILDNESSTVIVNETCRLLCNNCEKLFLCDETSSKDFISRLTSSCESQVVSLREDLLVEVAKKLRPTCSLSPSLTLLTSLVSQSIHSESMIIIEQLREGGADVTTATQPVFTPALQCGSAMLNATLRSFHSIGREIKSFEDSEDQEKITELQTKLEVQRSKIISFCLELKLFEICEKFLGSLCEIYSSSPYASSTTSLSSSSGSDLDKSEETEERDLKRQEFVSTLERYSKGSVLGSLLPPLLAVMADTRLCSLPVASKFLTYTTSLGEKSAECCSLLYAGYRGTINVPAPWANGRVVETIHPVRDNYKFKETVSFPGARHLYLKFDQRSSSQYDYDKVIVFAGDSPSSAKVAEYGGNTHGFGSRSVLGKGWPKDLVKVDGDTVTFTFEMKSGREHSTPDKAMWGFCCTVRPQETADETPSGLPFLLDLYLSISSINCSLIGQLFDGTPPTADELKCSSLMESTLLQKCTWPDDGEVMGGVNPAHRQPLQASVLLKIRNLVNKQRPVLRPTTSQILQVDLMEDVMLTTCLKLCGISSPLVLLSSDDLSEDCLLLLDEIFTRINGLERRLQALAELETRWWADIEEISSNVRDINSSFIFDLQQQESTAKQFELLCHLMSVEVIPNDTYTSVKQLLELMEKHVQRRIDQKDLEVDVHSRTRNLAAGVLDRTHLLLQVQIPLSNSSSSPSLSRSLSVPAHCISSASIINRQSSDGNNASFLVESLPSTNPTLLDEIFQFIGAKPEEAVSCTSFLSAASQQRQRGIGRAQALEFLQTVLTSHHLPATMEHLLACVGGVLQNGPCVKDIACSGHVTRVREAFADVMRAVVDLASHQPSTCINTIALLTIIPYNRSEESCLVRSGLVKLLDHLCSVSNLPVGQAATEEVDEETEQLQRVTTLAWAAFQVLADRCVSWERDHSGGFISSGLAQQVSLLLTNHLSRAMESLVTSESGTSDTLQEALSMLLGLARSHMGRTILSQPACVSKLLLLLTDQRPSPKLVLIALQLCRTALPLMTLADCSQVVIPPHSSLAGVSSLNLPSQIISLLMFKLAEYITPSNSQMRAKTVPDDEASPVEDTVSLVSPSQQDEIDESGHASVYLYRREEENVADLLQLLINQDPRQLTQRMENIIQMDQSLTEDGRAEIMTDTYRACYRRSIRLANLGFVVSIEPPSNGTKEPSGTESDRRKAKSEGTCKKKNLELMKTDPPRPFLSGTVAYSLASEIIALISGLLIDPDAAQVWKNAIQNVLKTSLESSPKCLPSLEKYCNRVHSCVQRCEVVPSPDDYLLTASLINATFAALGGFKDSLRPGMVVKVTGTSSAHGIVDSISERRSMVSVKFEDKYSFGPSQTLEVPLSRIELPEVKSLSVKQLGIVSQLCDSLLSVIDTGPVSISSPHTGMDPSLDGMGVCRLFAELRTRGCMCLASHMADDEFRRLFMEKCDVGLLQKQVQTVQQGQRQSVIESHCMNLRMLYRDCARPSAPKIERPRVERKKFHFDVTCSWPILSYCSFSHNMSTLVYQGQTTFTGGNADEEEEQTNKPKGAFVLTNAPIPSHAPSFYWEIELIQLDSGSTLPHLAFGYCQKPVKLPDNEVWFYPEETCLLRSSGRGFQVRGEDRMLWNKLTMDTPLKTGDIVGCGWLREEPADQKGVVYFTINGVRLDQTFKDCPAGLYPFVHVQKKGMRLKANFGNHPFAYPEGHTHRDAADVNKGESLEEIIEYYKLLPFADPDSDIDEEEEIKMKDNVKNEDNSITVEPINIGPQTHDLEPLSSSTTQGYDIKSSLVYFPRLSFDSMLESGPLVRPGWGSTHEEEEEEESSGGGALQEEDLHTLLVKLWEAKVFPTIKRRFRNDQERKSGLDQIRGALQLGMESIAQETVEFLYEENGGLPKDLHFPTMDDVKADLDKFTISRVKKGSTVVVQKDFPYSRCGIRAMQKTQGLTGIVLAVDELNELVQVECYVPSDGALVRFWYPVVYLERPPKGFRKPSALKGAESVNILVHRELLNCEMALSSMYCRSALITLHPISPSLTFPTYFNMLACHNFTQPSGEGLVSTTSPSLAPSLSHCLLSPSSCRHFYSDPSLVEGELSSWFSSHPNDSVSLVLRLNEELSQANGGNGRSEFSISDGRQYFDVYGCQSSFLIVSSIEIKPGSSSQATYKYPWAKVFVYRSGQGKSGRMVLQEISRYPNEITQSVNLQYCGSTFPSLMVPSNRLHVKLTGPTPPPGQVLVVHGVPSCLVLLMTVAESLSVQINRLYRNDSAQSPQMCHALASCINSLVVACGKTDWPLLVKEKLFHTLADVLWTLITLSDHTHSPPISSDFSQALYQELDQLYERECERFTTKDSGANPKGFLFSPPGSTTNKGCNRFSTYFQALLELSLALNEYANKYHAQKEATPTPNGKKNKKTKKGLSWLGYVRHATSLLLSLSHQQPVDRNFYLSFRKSLPSAPQSRLLVITGMCEGLDGSVATEIIQDICKGYGGLTPSGLTLFLRDQTREELEEEMKKLQEIEKSKAQEEKQATPKPTEENKRPSAGVARSDTAERIQLTEKKTVSHEEATPQATPITTPIEPKQVTMGQAVVELNCSAKASEVVLSLLSNSTLQGADKVMSVSCVSPSSTSCENEDVANKILSKYLKNKLYVSRDNHLVLREGIKDVLKELFGSVRIREVYARHFTEDEMSDCLLRLLVEGMSRGGRNIRDELNGLWEGERETTPLNLDMLIKWIERAGRKDPSQVWNGLTAAGYDFNLNRCGFLPSEVIGTCIPDLAKDHALTLHINSICRRLDVTSMSLHPSEVTISETDLASYHLTPLHGISLNDIRMRFLALKYINRQLSWLLPLVNLSSTHPCSLGHHLSKLSAILFYDVKTSFLHSVLNVATRRSLEQAPPEIKMDPLESVGGVPTSPLATQFCQAARQMLSVPSPQLCVPLACGGDPTYAFNVKLAGEEVHGTSGSFRHFLWQVVRELQSPLLPILVQCPSSSAGINKGKHILMTGPLAYSEEKLLEFFGQLLGVAIRADVPVALDLLLCFWKSLKNEELSLEDLQEADIITYSLTKNIIEATDEMEFQKLFSDFVYDKESQTETDTTQFQSESASLRFVYHNLRGEEEELVENGAQKVVSYDNRVEYAEAIRRFRLEELSSTERMTAIRCGMASVVPIEILSIFTAADLDLRICGLPDVDINYLKRHTTYHVGLMETDQHIEYFWKALESLSQEELRKFIKFACNQERIPFGHPCRDEGIVNVPPYPMKIAPPDTQGGADGRFIRAETCMFLIKLPQYSSQEIMTDRLKYAINCREDPLSG